MNMLRHTAVGVFLGLAPVPLVAACRVNEQEHACKILEGSRRINHTPIESQQNVAFEDAHNAEREPRFIEDAIGDTFIWDWSDTEAPSEGPFDELDFLVVSQKDTIPKKYISFLKFDLPPPQPNTTIEQAVLSVWVKNCIAEGGSQEGAVEAHTVSSPWAPNKVTVKNIPDIGRFLDYAVFSKPPDNEQFWMSWIVTEAVMGWYNGNPNFGFALLMNDLSIAHGECNYVSIEGGLPPRLTIIKEGDTFIQIFLPIVDFGSRLMSPSPS